MLSCFEGGINPAGLQLNISHEFGSVKAFNLNRWIMLGQLSTGFLPRDKITPPPVIYRFFIPPPFKTSTAVKKYQPAAAAAVCIPVTT